MPEIPLLFRVADDRFDQAYKPNSNITIYPEGGFEVIKGVQEDGSDIIVSRPNLSLEDRHKALAGGLGNLTFRIEMGFTTRGITKDTVDDVRPNGLKREFFVARMGLVAELVESGDQRRDLGEGEQRDLAPRIRWANYS